MRAQKAKGASSFAQPTPPQDAPEALAARSESHGCFSARTLTITHGVMALALLLAFLSLEDLPMVDLPQHAALLSAWVHRHDPDYHAQLYVLNLRTPYLMAYAMARLLAFGMPVTVAFKLVAWFAVVGQAAAIRYLCGTLKQEAWLSLLGLPLALGYNFLFGFISYIVAVPFAFVAIGLAVEQASQPTRHRSVWLTATLLMLLAAHGIAFAQAILFVTPLLLCGRGESYIRRIMPIVICFFAAMAWLLPGSVTNRLGIDQWDPSFGRLLSLPGLLVGSGWSDRPATWFGAILLGLILIGGIGPLALEKGRLIPAAATLLAYLAFPAMYRGYGPLWPRFALFLAPAVLLAFQPVLNRSTRMICGVRIACIAVSWAFLGLFVVRLWGFNREIAPFHRLVQMLPRNQRIRPIVFDPYSKSVPGTPLLNHLPALYYVEKGGTQGYSFAMYPASVIRYRPDVPLTMTGGAEWTPDAFRFDLEASNYDCYIVHSPSDRGYELFGMGLLSSNQRAQSKTSASFDPMRRLVDAVYSVRQTAHEGNWFSYCRTTDP